MNRTQKKCFVGAAGFHLLLIVILFVGPAFFSGDKSDDTPVLDFIPMITTDKPFSGGGSPTANPPPVPPSPSRQQTQIVPPTPKPPPQVEKVEKQEQKEIKTTKVDPDALEAKTEKPKIKVNKTLVTRSQVTKSNQKPPPKTDSQSAKNSGKEFSTAARRIRESASSNTEIEMPGVGGGGPSYANYAQVVKSIYTQAWVAPDDVEDNEATAKVSVTIARDGTVISGRLIQSSGNAAVDRSVQATLDRVTFVAPFPDGAKEKERTYKINFNLKAKQLLG